MTFMVIEFIGKCTITKDTGNDADQPPAKQVIRRYNRTAPPVSREATQYITYYIGRERRIYCHADGTMFIRVKGQQHIVKFIGAAK